MKKYKLNKGFITQKIDGKITIFDGEESQLITFNETATFLFDRIKKGFPEKEIVSQLVKKFKVKEDRASNDLKDLIHSLKKEKILL